MRSVMTVTRHVTLRPVNALGQRVDAVFVVNALPWPRAPLYCSSERAPLNLPQDRIPVRYDKT